MSESQKGYGFPSPITTLFPNPIITTRDPDTTDGVKKGFVIGQNWVNTTNNTVFVFTSNAGGSATWSLSTAGSAQLDTLTGDSGGAISPLAGNISILGTANQITTTGTPNTITYTTPTTFIAPGSIAATTTLSSVGATTLATAGASTNTFGNATGATSVAITSGTGSITLTSTGTGDILLDSDDTMLLDADGVLELNSSAGVIGIGNDADAQNINIGTGGAARTITIGNVTSTTGLVLNAGTGHVAINTTTTGDVLINSADTVLIDGAGVVELNSSAGAISIGNDAVAQAINIGTGAAARTISIGTGAAVIETIAIGGTGANVITIGNTQTGGSIAAGTAMTGGTISIGGTGLHTGNFDLSPGTGAQTVTLASGSGIKTINIGNGVSGNTVSIANGINTVAQTLNLSNGASGADSTVNILSGTATTGTLTLNMANGAGPKTVNVATGVSGNTVNVGTGINTSAQVINISTAASAADSTVNVLSGNASAGTITLNLATGNRAKTINVGTGVDGNTVNVASGINTTAQTVSVSSGAAGANSTVNVLSGNASAGTQTLNLGTGTGGKTINVATGAGANAVIIGSTTTSSATTIRAGTGGVTVTGNTSVTGWVKPTDINLTFNSSPIMQASASTGAAPTGTTGAVNLMSLQDGVIMEQFILGAGQTIIAPRMTTTGLLTSLDLINAEGAEYNFGVNPNSRFAFTIGTSAAFYMELAVNAANVGSLDPFVCGFRKQQTNQATFTAYTDFATIGARVSTAADTIILQTDLNNGGETITSTTDAWTDGQTKTFKILVSAAGVVTYTIGGSAPSVTAAFTFDNGDIVTPFIRHEFVTATPGAINLISLKIGFQ